MIASQDGIETDTAEKPTPKREDTKTVRIPKDAHRLADDQAAREGVPLYEWLARLIRRTTKKKA